MAGMLTEAVARQENLTPHERTVLLVLADHAKISSKRCWPGIKRIADRSGMSERHVSRILKVLQKRSLISIVGKHGNAGTNVYLLHLNHSASTHPTSKGNLTHSQDTPDTQSNSTCSTGTTHLTECQINNGSEQGNEQGKENKKTIGEPKHSLTAKSKENDQEEKKEKIDQQEAEQALPEEAPPPPVPLAPLPGSKDSTLVALWKSEVKKLGLAALVSAAEGKMLRSFTKHAGYENVSAVIPAVVEGWFEFTIYCEKTAGAFKSPKEPDIRYLVKHQSKALDFYKDMYQKAMSSTPNDLDEPLKCLQHLCPKEIPAKKSLAEKGKWAQW